MKIIFEYEDGTYRIVPSVNIRNIEERKHQNYLVDRYLFQTEVVNKYIIANDNRLGGFERHKDIKNIQLTIKHLEKSIELQNIALDFYRKYEDLSVPRDMKEEM